MPLPILILPPRCWNVPQEDVLRPLVSFPKPELIILLSYLVLCGHHVRDWPWGPQRCQSDWWNQSLQTKESQTYLACLNEYLQQMKNNTNSGCHLLLKPESPHDSSNWEVSGSDSLYSRHLPFNLTSSLPRSPLLPLFLQNIPGMLWFFYFLIICTDLVIRLVIKS